MKHRVDLLAVVVSDPTQTNHFPALQRPDLLSPTSCGGIDFGDEQIHG